MDAEKIKELRELVAAATAGPWEVGNHYAKEYGDLENCSRSITLPQDGLQIATVVSDAIAEHEANAALIVAAVNSLPALLDEVEALTKDGQVVANMARRFEAAYHEKEAEVEALTADAERYRFIRDGKSRGDVDLCICIAHWTEEPVLYSVRAEERADAAIDAARHEPKDAELSQSVSAYDPKRDDWHEGEQND